MRRIIAGFTLLELLITMGFVAIVGFAAVVELRGRRSGVEFSGTATRMVALLRDAQTRAVAQSEGSSWGVRFDNASSSPFYALFRSPYATGTVVTRIPLPPSVSYVSSTVPVGGAIEIVFFALTGYASASTTIAVGAGTSSSTIAVSAKGAISF